MTPSAVGITCLVLNVIILIWDGFLDADKIRRNTISQVIIDNSKKWPILPALIGFEMGVLIGHWFL